MGGCFQTRGEHDSRHTMTNGRASESLRCRLVVAPLSAGILAGAAMPCNRTPGFALHPASLRDQIANVYI